MINILFVFGGEFHRGGTEKVMINILEHINHEKFHIDFLLLGHKGQGTEGYDTIQKFKGKIYCVTPRKESWSQQLKEIKQLFERKHFDIIHTHTDALAADCLRIAKQCDIKVRIAHSHNTNHKTKYKGVKGYIHEILMEQEKYSVRHNATHYIACSMEAGVWLFGKKNVQGSNFMIFKNAIEVDKYKYSSYLSEKKKTELGISDKLILGHVGRFDYQKNHSYLLNIFEQVHIRNSNTVLVLVGEGELEPKIKEEVKHKGLEKDVIFLGTRSDVNELMQMFDVFIFPSRYEGLGIVLIEAQAAGVKCFASSEIPKEVNLSGNVVFLDINLEPEVWAKKIIQYLTIERNKESAMREDAIKYIIYRGYDINTNIKKLEDFYKYCLN